MASSFDLVIKEGLAVDGTGNPWLYKQRLYTNAIQPSPHCFSSKLRPIIRSDLLRYSPEDD